MTHRSTTVGLVPALFTVGAWLLPFTTSANGFVTVDFEDLDLSTEDYWNGADQSGTFISRGVAFNNAYDPTWGNWAGWAYSRSTDTDLSSFSGQYTAFTDPPGGASGSANYGVGYVDAFTGVSPNVAFDGEHRVFGAQFTNNAFVHDSIENGDQFAKQFGYEDNHGVEVPDGSYPDWFRLTVTGMLNGVSTGSIDFYLADFRFVDNADDYIVSDWTYSNLSELGVVDGLEFSLASSDVGDFGMNTPAYFAMDSLAVIEPAGFADFNIDGVVDGDDFLIWQTGFGRTDSTRAQGDADGDRDVDGDDFLIWQSEFNVTGSGGSTARTVPEPTACALTLMAIIARLVGRRPTA